MAPPGTQDLRRRRPQGRTVCNGFLSWAVPRSHIAIQRRRLVYAGANNESRFSIYTGFDSVCGLATWPADVGGPRHAVVQPLKRQANRVGRRFWISARNN